MAHFLEPLLHDLAERFPTSIQQDQGFNRQARLPLPRTRSQSRAEEVFLMLLTQALCLLLVYDILSTLRPFKSIHSTVKHWKVAKKPVAPDTTDRVCSAVNYACA